MPITWECIDTLGRTLPRENFGTDCKCLVVNDYGAGRVRLKTPGPERDVSLSCSNYAHHLGALAHFATQKARNWNLYERSPMVESISSLELERVASRKSLSQTQNNVSVRFRSRAPFNPPTSS